MYQRNRSATMIPKVGVSAPIQPQVVTSVETTQKIGNLEGIHQPGSVSATPVTTNLNGIRLDPFNGVRPVNVEKGTPIRSTLDIYNGIISILKNIPNTPEIQYLAAELKQLGDNGQFNGCDSVVLSKLMNAITDRALKELYNEDDVSFSKLMEILCTRAGEPATTEVDKWTKKIIPTNPITRLVNKVMDDFMNFLRKNKIGRIGDMGKFKKHFQVFVSSNPEYKEVKIKDAWDAYSGRVI